MFPENAPQLRPGALALPAIVQRASKKFLRTASKRGSRLVSRPYHCPGTTSNRRLRGQLAAILDGICAHGVLAQGVKSLSAREACGSDLMAVKRTVRWPSRHTSMLRGIHSPV